jgi:hypothetical protein
MKLSPFFYDACLSAYNDRARGWIDDAGYLRRLEQAAEAERITLAFPQPVGPQFTVPLEALSLR